MDLVLWDTRHLWIPLPDELVVFIDFVWLHLVEDNGMYILAPG